MIIQKNKAYLALKNTIEASIEGRRVDFFSTLSRKSYLKEYGTIRFMIHRMSGHTTNALDLVPTYFDSVYWVVDNERCRKSIEREYCRENVNNVEFFSISNVIEKLNTSHRPMSDEATCVVVDMASMVNTTKLEKIYDCLANYSGLNAKLTLLLLE